MRSLIAVAAVGVLLLARGAAAAPPRVTKAVPDNADAAVDPGTKQIVVTFDQDMSRNGMSVVGAGELFPEITAKPSWKDARTFVIPVKLAPNHDYQLSINSDRFQKFTNPAGEPAVPYPIRFHTAGGGPLPAALAKVDSATKAANEAAIAKLTEALTLQYSHRDRLKLDWPALIAERREALVSATTSQEFAKIAAALLARAEDKHILLEVGDARVPAYSHPVTPNVNPKLLSQAVPSFRQLNGIVAMGRWPDGIGYLAIHSWDRSKSALLLAAFEALWDMHNAPALIIDLRLNGGGDESIARTVAGCFLDKSAAYARRDRVDPDHLGQFTPPYESIVEPSKQRPRYRGSVAVLIGPAVISSCESFVLMMKQVPNAVLVGAATQGSSGNPQPHDLGNGVTVYLPSWREMMVDGTQLEGHGIARDVDVTATPQDFTQNDPVIEAGARAPPPVKKAASEPNSVALLGKAI